MRAFFFTCFAALLGAWACAQSPTGTISGIVLDPDAKAVAGAEIILVNDLTRVQYETKTNELGLYTVPNLPPGPYRVQASRIGFKTIIRPDITVNVQDSITVNFTLPIGATSIAITVEGGAPMINTTDAAVSTVVDRQFAENLPLNGRSFQTLIYLTPGVVTTPSTANDSGQFSVNGQRAVSNYWMVDGVSANIGMGVANVGGGNGLGGTLGSFSALGGTNSLVSVDALQEFRIQTSTFAPEFGRTPGGQIAIVTRSGTNRFHGSAFEYLRNDALDANNWFANAKGLAKPEERQNDFGGTVSGPLWRDRSFFFFSYEGLRLRLPQTVLTTVPDLDTRESATAAVQPFLNAYPKPNGPAVSGTESAEFNASFSNPASLDAVSIRIDHRINDQWAVFGRYNYSPSGFLVRGGDSGTAAASVLQTNDITTQTATAGLTWSVARVVNDLRFNYSRVSATGRFYVDAIGDAVPLSSLPFPASFSSENGLFLLQIFSLQHNAIEVGKAAQNVQRQINFVDTLSWQRGQHGLKFGFDHRRLSPLTNPRSYQQDAFLKDVPSAAAGSARSGLIFSYNGANLLFRNMSIFGQDTWRVTPRFTVTYGLRWDVDFAPESLSGPPIPGVTGYNLNDFSGLSFAAQGVPPFHTKYGNVAPRFGAAYQLSQNADWQSVVRGGVGQFYDLVSSEAGDLIGTSFPPFAAHKSFSSVPFPFTADQVSAPPVPQSGTIANLFAFNPDVKLPYTIEWNLAFEQTLAKNQTISFSYVGAAGRQLLQTLAFVSPASRPELFGYFVDNSAYSRYDALQIQFQRRLARGLQALASYTWSHSIDNGSSGFIGNTSNYGAPGSYGENRGDSSFDVRNAATIALTYDTPPVKGGAVAKAVFGGWSVQTLVLARSALPVDISDVNFFTLPNGAEQDIRPDLVAGQPRYLHGSQFPGGKAINPAAFMSVPFDPVTFVPARQGTLGRDVFRGFGSTQWDFAVHRTFPIRESIKLQLRVEMFNVLNHPNFAPPNNLFGTGGFGLSNQTLGQSLSSGNVGGGGLNPLYQIGGPRSIQMALKLNF